VAAGTHGVIEYAFDADTRVDAVADGAFTATITDRWNAIGGRPNGGYVVAVCLQALRRVMPFPDPLVVSAFFMRPTLPGPAEVRTEVARAGRSRRARRPCASRPPSPTSRAPPAVR
jgi:acyl-CoA thioesterase superfamily protein